MKYSLQPGSLQPILQTTILELEKCVQALGDNFDQPVLVDYGGFPFFRHMNLNDLLACYLKCVRIVSSLNATLVLLEKGFVQEIYVLCRANSTHKCNANGSLRK